MKDHGKQQTGAKNTVEALPSANIAVLSYCVVICVTGESDSSYLTLISTIYPASKYLSAI